MENLTRILIEATSAIEKKYFQLEIAEGAPIYRERVYCYELYHQMRSVWTKYGDEGFTLNGEVDKQNHPIFVREEYSKVIPDFLVHKPGDMGGNHTIIEVKTPRQHGNYKKDLCTLKTFRDDVGYQRAIYLIYGYEALQFAEEVMKYAATENITNIECWVHCRENEAAREFTLET